MKLFWKLFYSMVLMTVLFCSVGGYYLIYRQFETSMEKEVDGIFEENDFLCHMVMKEKKNYPLEDMKSMIETLELSVGQRKLYFRICDREGNPIGENGSLPVASFPLVSRLSEEEQGWELVEGENKRVYLHGAAAMILEGNTVFLENYKDVTVLYEERKEQIFSFYQMMTVFICMIGILAFVIVRFLLKPIRLLSETTRRIAGGELYIRVPVRTEDELGRLSKDFNSMADNLEQKIEELEETAIRQEEFMGSFAHEMKTPLTSIIGYADLLRSMELKPEKVRENANYIFKEGQRLENLSMKMMELIVVGKEELDRRLVPANLLFGRLENEICPILQKAQIEFRVKWEDAVLFVEEDLMITVCLNLLDNGRKAVVQKQKLEIAKGEEKKTIKKAGKKKEIEEAAVYRGVIVLSGYGTEHGYCICVTDNGIGIPAEEKDRIREAFYMVDKSRARAMGGAGLGLSICDKIVSLHGGKLEIDSCPGEGSTVRICLEGGEQE